MHQPTPRRCGSDDGSYHAAIDPQRRPVRGRSLRILVERLWPRGVSKQKAKIDFWLKTLAPSTELRQWYGHDPARGPQFRKQYWAELKGQGDVLTLLKYVTQQKAVTFVYAANDEEWNS